jgi:hypothetical protein
MNSARLGYIARICVVGAIAGLASLRASIGDGLDSQEWVDLVQAVVVAGAAYAGVGAISTTLEPGVGRKDNTEA